MCNEKPYEKVITKKTGHWRKRCKHNKFLVHEELGYVECGICGEHLNPIWVVIQLCNYEARVWRNLESLTHAANEASKRNRCKCEHCKEMTRIVK